MVHKTGRHCKCIHRMQQEEIDLVCLILPLLWRFRGDGKYWSFMLALNICYGFNGMDHIQQVSNISCIRSSNWSSDKEY
jgi:hypothetical protein